MLKRRIEQLRESSKVSIAQKFQLRICDTYILIEYHDMILCYMDIEISASIEQFTWHVVDITFFCRSKHLRLVGQVPIYL